MEKVVLHVYVEDKKLEIFGGERGEADVEEEQIVTIVQEMMIQMVFVEEDDDEDERKCSDVFFYFSTVALLKQNVFSLTKRII